MRCLISLDTLAGRLGLPGVEVRSLTAADVARVRYGGSVKDEEVFARDRVRFAGQPLACRRRRLAGRSHRRARGHRRDV